MRNKKTTSTTTKNFRVFQHSDRDETRPSSRWHSRFAIIRFFFENCHFTFVFYFLLFCIEEISLLVKMPQNEEMLNLFSILHKLNKPVQKPEQACMSRISDCINNSLLIVTSNVHVLCYQQILPTWYVWQTSIFIVYMFI